MDITLDHKKDQITYSDNSAEILKMFRIHFGEYTIKYTEFLYNIRKHFLIDGYSYADHLSYFVFNYNWYFNKAPGFFTVFNYIDTLEEISKHTRKNDTWNLYIEDFYDNLFIECALIVAKSKNIKVTIKKNTLIKNKHNLIYSNKSIMTNFVKARISLRYILGTFRKLLMRTCMSKSDVVIMSNSILFNENPEKNLVFGGIVSELNTKGIDNKIIYYDQLFQTEKIIKLVKEEAFKKHSYIGDYYTLRHFVDCEKDFRKIRMKWKSLIKHPSFRKLFRFRGYDLFDLMVPRLNLTFNSLSYIYCDDRYITKRIIGKSGLKVALIDHEENMYGKGLILNLKNSEEKVFALSHELISDNTMHLHFKSKKVLDRRSDDWRPLPDIKFVWGEYAKDKLINRCNYPDKILRITGNPKFDQLYHKYNSSYNNTVLNNLKDYRNNKKITLSNRHKKVLISDQSRDVDIIEYNKLAKALPEYDFIIKPHPNDVTSHWETLLEDRPENLYIVDRYTNIYDLINASDYVLIRSSTSGFESMMLGKTIFIYNPDYEKILQSFPYEESGAVKTLHTPEEFRVEVHKIEKDSKYRKKLDSNRKNFIRKVHAGEGTASLKIVAEIKKELRNPAMKS